MQSEAFMARIRVERTWGLHSMSRDIHLRGLGKRLLLRYLVGLGKLRNLLNVSGPHLFVAESGRESTSQDRWGVNLEMALHPGDTGHV